MASKKTRAFFVVEGFLGMREKFHLTQSDAIKALDTNAHTLNKLENGEPLTKAAVLKILRKYSNLHPEDLKPQDIEGMIVDVRHSSLRVVK